MADIDRDLTDEDLRMEIELVCALVIAAAEHDRPLTQAEIDAALGLDPAGPALLTHSRAS